MRYTVPSILSMAVAASLSLPGTANAQEPLDQIYGNEETLMLATGSIKPLSKAPAIATVITADDIQALGFTELDQALETVPGLHVTRNPIAYNAGYQIRGIATDDNTPQVLMMVDGIPITSIFNGDRGNLWGGMPLQSVSRIEVVRGPGSALYGADAYAGVINIVTKSATEINGTEVGARTGSFDTQGVWLLHGGNVGNSKLMLSVEADTSNGQHKTIQADAQSFLDSLFGTQASLAPGPVDTGIDRLNTHMSLSRGRLTLHGAYEYYHDIGPGAGIAAALDPTARLRRDRLTAGLSYDLPNVPRDWMLRADLSYMRYRQETDLTIFPPGANYGSGTFTAGVIGRPDESESHTRAQLTANYTALPDHQIKLGAGIYYADLYETREDKNFYLDPVSGLPVPLGSVQSFDDTGAVFLSERGRTDYFLFAQDEWIISGDWELTAGARYDHYSDFGSTFNPRLALVWSTDYDLTTKVLYGRAFRAPAFIETEPNGTNPVNLGNPSLRPETIDTLELGWDYHPVQDWNAALNLYGYRMRDVIRFVHDVPPATTSTAQNAGSINGYGLELEFGWNPTPELRITGSYAYQNARDIGANHALGTAPRHQYYLRADWHPNTDWRFNAQFNRIEDRQRGPGDSRPPVPDYQTVDVNLIYAPSAANWKASLGVTNLFNANLVEPVQTENALLIPGDLPLAGRAVTARVEARF